jgi:CYTH domain-containing protein/CHAD domain-containing protein
MVINLQQSRFFLGLTLRMPDETERRFLVRGEEWRRSAKTQVEYRQGYLSLDPYRNVRVRASANGAVITIKGNRHGLTRSEFEYAIPLDDANILLSEVCQKPLIQKTRFTVPANRRTWEVDEYKNENQGLTVAELKLLRDGHRFSKPAWVGEEISGDERFSNAALVSHPYRTWHGAAQEQAKFHLRHGESVAEGLARSFHEQLDVAITELSRNQASVDDGIHEARKCLKRTRALLRLARPALGRAYRDQNAQLRDMAHKLSELRDMQALAETIDHLKEDEASRSIKSAFERLRGAVLKRKEELFREAEKQNELAGAVEKLREIREGLAALPLERANHEILTSAFEETVRRGREAFSRAFKDQQEEHLHECRKRTKDLRYQLEFLHKMWPDVLSGYADAAKHLEQTLGKHHDLSVLAGMTSRKTAQGKKDATLLSTAFRKEQKPLRTDAESIGQLLYSEGPQVWAERLERCWQAW